MYRSVGSKSNGFLRTQIFHMGCLKPSPAPNTIKTTSFCSLFLHFCIAVCFSDSRAPNTIKTNGFCSLFLHFCIPIPPFVHSFTPSSLPLLLSVSLPTCLGPKNTQNGRCTYIANFSRSHLPSTSELGFGHVQWGLGHAELGFGHVKLGFTHAELGLGHAELGFRHAELGFGHEKCQP